MTLDVTLRLELPSDIDAIRDLTERAFAPMPFSSGTEPEIIDALRDDGDLLMSLVAEQGGRVIGHVAISPVRIADLAGWVGLGPISVDPDFQRRGLGAAMLARVRDDLRARGIAGIALIGNPAVYGPMGFRSSGLLTYGDVRAEVVQFLTMSGPDPVGELTYSPAFSKE